ncbi:hypothetical protein QQ045_015560 [Rhodiola kirilowii]
MKVVWGSFGSLDAIFKDVDMPLPYEMWVLLRWGEHTITNGHTCTKLSILPNQQVTDENLSAYGTARSAETWQSSALKSLFEKNPKYRTGAYFDIEICQLDGIHRVGISRWIPSRFFVGSIQWGGDVGTQYRSGIYYYNDEQERLAKESLDSKQNEMKGKKIVTEILPTKRFYRAEEYHQQYLAKGGRNG